MKKKWGASGIAIGVFLIAVVVLSLSSLVSAYWGSSYGGYFGSSIDSVVRAWEPIFGAIFGGFGWNGMYLFERVLLFLVLMIFVYLALMKVPMFEGDDKKTFRWVIAIIIPLIGIRWIDYAWLTSIIVHYTFLAILLTAVLPFLLYFYFIYTIGENYDVLRKVLWILFIGIYAGLWQTTTQTDNTIFMWTMIAAIVCLFLDGTIMRRYRALQQIKGDERRKNQLLSAIDTRIQLLNNNIANNIGDEKINKAELKDLIAHRKFVAKQ